jgi:hypothetical protein
VKIVFELEKQQNRAGLQPADSHGSLIQASLNGVAFNGNTDQRETEILPSRPEPSGFSNKSICLNWQPACLAINRRGDSKWVQIATARRPAGNAVTWAGGLTRIINEIANYGRKVLCCLLLRDVIK